LAVHSRTNGTGNGLSNTIQGNSRANVLKGGGGADTLNGSGGNDKLYGGKGRDAFVFDTKLRASSVDTIVKFSAKDDTIWLDRDIFTRLHDAGSTIGARAFYASTSGKAHDKNDRILYETDTGKLFYDDNGNRSGHSVQIAQLDDGLHLTQADFLIV
jgi:serralysin